MLVVKARTAEAKIKAKAKALKAKSNYEVTPLKTKSKANASALKSKAKGMNFCSRGSSRPRSVLEGYNTGFVISASAEISLCAIL